METKGLTLSVIFEAQSANYSEGMSNIQILKKMSRDTGPISYISRQALRYNIIEQMGQNITPVENVGSGAKKVVQFAPSATITNYPEIDLFGYMKTVSSKNKNKAKEEDSNEGTNNATRTRSAVVRLSHALSLERFNGDMDYLTNMGLAKRGGYDNNISQSEIHYSYYAYTITVDLDCVGVEKDMSGRVIEEIDNADKSIRVKELLKSVENLYRDIKGRRENLSPVFVIGGVYTRKNPYFEGRFKVARGRLVTDILEAIINASEEVKSNTRIGYIGNMFINDSEIKEKMKPIMVSEFFARLCNDVEAYYNE